MAFEDWEKGPDGNIRVHPVTGWDIFVPFGMACGVRFHYPRSEQELRRGVSHKLPLVLAPAQARELAAALLKMADQAEQKPGTSAS